MIYLDNNATTMLDPRVAEVMLDCWTTGPMNPSSQHRAGRRAANRLDEAISQIGALLGADVDSPGGAGFIVTSGGTEANNLAIRGIGDRHRGLVVSAVEHPSVLRAAAAESGRGRRVDVLPVDAAGIVDIEALRRLCENPSTRPSLVSVMAANNETGVVQKIAEVAAVCAATRVLLHVDAVQVIGKLPFSFAALGAAAVSIAAHKFHGPVGIGGLLVKPGIEVRPLLHGGDQQLAQRAGTEPVALVVGMAEALRLAVESLEETTATLRRYGENLEGALTERFDEIVIHGEGTERLPGTSCMSFPGADRQAMLMALDAAGVACSSGSACASGSSRPSHVLEAMGVPERLIATALRFGFSRFSTVADCSDAIEIISSRYQRLREKKAVEKSE